MKYINLQLSEIDIIQILNALSYFRNEITWHETVSQKQRIGMYFNFNDPIEYAEQYNLLDNLHKRLSLQANKDLYNIINEYFFEGQKNYLINEKSYKLIIDNNTNYINKNDKKIFKIFVKNTIDKFKKIV